MLNCPDPERPKKTIDVESSPLNLFVTEDAVDGATRRSDLGISLLDCLSDHDCGDDFGEESTAEALAVFMTTTAYLMCDFGLSETQAIREIRHMFRRCKEAARRLGPRHTAREVFTELSVMAEETQEAN